MSGQCISIGSALHQNLLKYDLNHDLQLLRQQGFNVRLTEDHCGDITFLECMLAKTDQNHSMLERQLAKTVADLIINKWEKILVQDIIREKFYYFDSDEKNVIYDYTQKKLHQNWQGREKNKLAITHKLQECIADHQKIVIEGFIQFRLKEYINLLYEITDQAVDDFLMDRECREFIELLQYFVEIQEPQVENLHVVLTPSGRFQLYDEKHQTIDSEYLRDFMLDLVDHDINMEDLLISALITIAPRKINIHVQNTTKFATTLDMIKSIFVGRVFNCDGCPLCSP